MATITLSLPSAVSKTLRSGHDGGVAVSPVGVEGEGHVLGFGFGRARLALLGLTTWRSIFGMLFVGCFGR